MLVKVSFIIPTFRSTLRGLINYIQKILIEAKLDAEIIIINDLHTRFLSILDFPKEFNSLDIKIINNLENNGPGYSRNIGILNSKNPYLCFLDDDDDLSVEGLSKLKTLYSEADIISLKFIDSKGTFSNTHLVTSLASGTNCTGDLYVKTLNESGFLASHCQPYLFQKKFLADNNLTYPHAYIVEDISFVTACLIQCKKISIYDFDFYIYSSRPGTLKEDSNFLRFIDIFFAANWLKTYLSDNLNFHKKELLEKTLALLNLLFICRVIHNEINLVQKNNSLYFNETSDKILHSILHSLESYQYLEKIYFDSKLKISDMQSVQVIANKLDCYFSYTRNKINEKVTLKNISHQIILLYCYGPISIGFYLMLKNSNPLCEIFFIDDNINSEQKKDIAYGNYTMRLEEFISYNDLILKKCNLKIVICHLHLHVIKKIYGKSIRDFSKLNNSNFSLEINDLYTIFK